jgi:hypothetical protein
MPWWDFAWGSIIKGELPLWNPWLGMGAPLAANYQTAIFYPPNWIYPLVLVLGDSSWMAWAMALVVVVHLIWAGIGTSKLLKNMGVSELGQMIGSLAFSLSGYLVARASFLSIISAAAWLPWLLYYSKKIAERKTYFWKLCTIIALQLLAGHAQISWYSIIFTVPWTAFWVYSNNIESGNLKDLCWAWVKLAGAGLLAAGISAIQLIPTAEYLLLSQRASEFGYQEAMTYSFWPWRTLTLIVPDLFGNPGTGNYWGYGNYWEDAIYIGLVPLCLALGFIIHVLVLSRNKKKEAGLREANYQRLAVFLIICFTVSIILALGKNTFVFPFLYNHIPTFNLFQAPTRFSIWAVIVLVLLAGLGVDIIKRPQGKSLYAARLIAAGCFAITLGAIAAQIFLPEVKSTFIKPLIRAGLLGLGFAILVINKPSREETTKSVIWSWVLVGLVSIDLITAGWKLNPAMDRDFYQRSAVGEVQGRLFMPDDLEYELKYNQFFLFDSFEPKLSWDFMYEYHLPNLNMLERREMINNFDPILPARYQIWIEKLRQIDLKDRPDLAEIMAVNSVIVKNDADEIEVQKISEEVDYVQIFDCTIFSKSDENSLALIFEDNIDLGEILIIEGDGPSDASCKKDSTGTYSVVSSKPGHLNLDVELEKDAWIFWSQEWYPGWIGLIDGNKSEVKRSNFLFQAIYSKSGRHTVEFAYRPKSFYWGSAVSGLSIIVLLAGYGSLRKEGFKKTD